MRWSRAIAIRVVVLAGALAAVAMPFPCFAALDVRIVECDAVPSERLRIVGEPLGEAEGEAEKAPIEVDAGQQRFVPLELGDEAFWELRVESPGLWSEERRVRPAVDETVELHVWRRSGVVGRWSVPQAEEEPVEVVWRLRPVGGQDALAPSRCPVEELIVSCPVGEEGAFDCPLPVGRWNIRAKAQGWAAQHFWKVELAPGTELDLGRRQLRRGATLLGEVTTVDGPAHPKAARIELLPIAALDRDPEASRERRLFALTAQLNDQGFFLFEDVPPGLYELRAHQPGYSPARVGPVEVRADLETTILQPLVLAPPIHLTVVVDPPRPSADDSWRVRLDPAGDTTSAPEHVIEGETDEEGKWTSPALDVGDYLVSILDGGENVLAVEGPLSFAGRDAPFLRVSLDLIEIAGEVRLGDEPLAAELWFGGQTGARKVHATSDQEGRFEAVLPGEGQWTVDVFAAAAGVSVRGHSVEVEDGDDELVIELSATELAGSVVDEQGTPVPEASVRVIRVGEGDPFVTVSDGEGRFVVRGLPPATYWLEAVSGDRSSVMHTAVVTEEVVPPPVRLVVEARLSLAGRVVADRGGVAGAAVIALPFLADGSMGSVSDTVTGVDGGFALRLPPATAETLLVVMPLGFGLTVQRVEGAGPVEVRAAPAEGVVRLAAPSQAETGEVGLLFVGGEPVDVNLLRQWAHLHGGEPTPDAGLRVPALPSGTYAYCTLTIEEAMLVVSGRARPTRCSNGFLSAGGELALPLR